MRSLQSEPPITHNLIMCFTDWENRIISVSESNVWILNVWKVINRQAQKSVNLKIKGFVFFNPPMSLFHNFISYFYSRVVWTGRRTASVVEMFCFFLLFFPTKNTEKRSNFISQNISETTD